MGLLGLSLLCCGADLKDRICQCVPFPGHVSQTIKKSLLHISLLTGSLSEATFESLQRCRTFGLFTTYLLGCSWSSSLERLGFSVHTCMSNVAGASQCPGNSEATHLSARIMLTTWPQATQLQSLDCLISCHFPGWLKVSSMCLSSDKLFREIHGPCHC